ncbi:hypothetical protein EHI44_10980 [Rhizobium leguminosarum]|uniref:HNH endonuclease n=1 Tax=Rhizobium leguminosarum TaxID=384 RepID=UPI00027D8BE8|nr:HNH endonuclease [Rhizobium leguminosarum]RWY88572.1 hypothetical protein EHI44_10980 [Rhizobium leguminosarum]TAY16789.1 hypothetical protein ELH91_08390 [Rhizobium leguminosarum]
MKLKIDHAQRAGRLWPVLAAAAKDKRELTYGEAASAIGIHYRAMTYALGPIQEYCLVEGLPRLTGLVYAVTTGLPGGGYYGEPGNKADVEEVWNFDWTTVENPFSDFHNAELDAIAEEVIANPAGSALRFVNQLCRGDQQRVFRRAVLAAYDYSCAICETTFEEVLQAAHIIPFGDPRSALRIDPRNGIALCANHHRLFDTRWITITHDYAITFVDPDLEVGDYTEEDQRISVGHHLRKLALPAESSLWPDPKLLLERNG